MKPNIMFAKLYTVVLFLISCQVIRNAEATIQAYGCEEGWTNFEDHCYSVVVGEWDSNSAKNVCKELSANATSIWSPSEMAFIASLWQQYPHRENPNLWTGLRGGSSASWYWEDRSSFSVLQQDTEEYWTVLDEMSKVKGSTSGRCLALTQQGDPTILDCTEMTGGVACKKPLPRVFALSTTLNESKSDLNDPLLDSVHLFQRMLPPFLTTLPSHHGNASLAELEVATDTHCAFKCYSTPTCSVIELSCVTQFHCETYRCSLFAGITI